ncbi:MAG: glycosyltransferase family 39 protein [Chitinispirillaceae bacterium]|nr:glycosyltransferase family 39 protein [Chitinispirillaceae bacterium]
MKKQHIFYAILLFAGALIVRMPGISHHSIWFDEASTAFNITQTDLFKAINTTESTPPLFFYLEKFVIQWFHLPLSEWSLRLLPMLFESVSCVLFFFIFSSISNRKLGFLSYVLLLIASSSINTSHDARTYSLFTLTALSSLWFTLRWWQSQGSKNTIGLAVFTVLLIQTHYYAVFWVAALLLSVLLVKFNDKQLKRYFVIVISAALVSSLSLLHLLSIQSAYQFDSSKSYLLLKWIPGIVYTPVKILIGAYLSKILNLREISWIDLTGIISTIAIVIVSIVLFFRRLYYHQISDREKILSFSLFIGYSIHIGIGWVIPCVHPRYMAYHLILLFGFIVINTALKKWTLTTAMTLLITFNVIANFKYYKSHKPYIVPWRIVGATIDNHVNKNGGQPLPVLAHYSICLPVGFYVQNRSVPFYHIDSPANKDQRFTFAKMNLFGKNFYTTLYHYTYFEQKGSTSFIDLVTELKHGYIVDRIEHSIDRYIPQLKERYKEIVDFKVISSMETNQGTVFLIDWKYIGSPPSDTDVSLYK